MDSTAFYKISNANCETCAALRPILTTESERAYSHFFAVNLNLFENNFGWGWKSESEKAPFSQS